jgi:hypothetical protein
MFIRGRTVLPQARKSSGAPNHVPEQLFGAAGLATGQFGLKSGAAGLTAERHLGCFQWPDSPHL